MPAPNLSDLPVPPSNASGEDLSGLPVPGGGWDSSSPLSDPWTAPPPVQTLAGGAQAGSSGFNAGVVDAAGLPMDVAYDLASLGQAGLGYGYSKLTGKAPPEALQVANEADVPGTSGWLKNQIRGAGYGNLIDAQQGTTLDKYLHGAGEGAGSATAMGPVGEGAAEAPGGATVLQGLAGAAGGTATEKARQEGVKDPALLTAINMAAGMAPGLLADRNPAFEPADQGAPSESAPKIGPITPDEMTARAPAALPSAPSSPENPPVARAESAEVPASSGIPPEATHEVQSATGSHVFKLAGGELHAQETDLPGGRTALKVERSDVAESQRGHGVGYQLYRTAANHALANGAVLASDVSVSPSAAAVYAKLGRAGYTVRMNPATRSPTTGNLVSNHPKVPVFEVTARPLPLTHSSKGPFAMVSAERKELTPAQNLARSQELTARLRAAGLRYRPTAGMYQGTPEQSFAVATPSPQAAAYVDALGTHYGQESTLHVASDRSATLHMLADGNHVPLGQFQAVEPQVAAAQEGWTRDPTGQYYAINPTTPAPAAPEAPTSEPPPSPGFSFVPPAEENARTELRTPAERAAAVQTLRRVGVQEAPESVLQGDRKEASSDYQTSQVGNDAGKEMFRVLEHGRQSLRTFAGNLVGMSGGIDGSDASALYDRGTAILRPIEEYERGLDQQIKQAYAEATARAQGIPIKLPALTNFLQHNRSAFLNTLDGKQLLEGVMTRAKELGLLGPNDTFNPATVEQAERLRQYLNDSWSPRIAHLVYALKDAIDEDVTRSAGKDIYATGRQIRTLRAKILEEQPGIRKLLHPTDRLGIDRDVPAEKVPHYVTGLPYDQFRHVVRVLDLAGQNSAASAANALNEIRTQFAIGVRDAGDKTANMWNSKGVSEYLRGNHAKMALVFRPAEMRMFQDLHDAGNILRIDQRYPGAAAQKETLMQKGVLGLSKHAEAVGGIVGHIPGAAIGYGAEKLAHPVAERLGVGAVRKRVTTLDEEPEEPPPPKGGARRSPPAAQRGGPKLEREAGEAPAGATPQAMLTFRHFTSNQEAPERMTLDPNRYGQGLKGAEAARIRYSGAPKVIAAYGAAHPDEAVEPELRGRPEYRITVPQSRVYDLSADPEGIRVAATQGGRYDHSEAERQIQKRGYAGYHIPNGQGVFKGQARFFEPIEAVRRDVAEKLPSGALSRQRGGAATIGRAAKKPDAAIRTRFQEQLQDHAAAVKSYAAIPATRSGKILSVDDARELSPDYLADRTRSAAVHEPASTFIKRLYAERLAEKPAPGESPTVLFMAGGTGAGKTSALRASPALDELAKKVQIIYDTNMNSFGASDEKIRQALHAGKEVRIVMVQRHPVDALVNGALARATRQEARFGTGRTVPIDAHLDTHIGASTTVPKLAKQYADNPRVHFTYIDNSHGAGKAVEIGPEQLRQYDAEETRKALHTALDAAHKNGHISEATYRGFKGE